MGGPRCLCAGPNVRTDGVVLAEGMKGFRDLSGSEDAPVDLDFKDVVESGNFALHWRARLGKELLGFEKIPFSEIGLYKDAYRRNVSAAE